MSPTSSQCPTAPMWLVAVTSGIMPPLCPGPVRAPSWCCTQCWQDLQKCPAPLRGEIDCECECGVLRVYSDSCAERVVVTDLSPEVQEGGEHRRAGGISDASGFNYHAIETTAAFAIAETSRFMLVCPTLVGRSGQSATRRCPAKQACSNVPARRQMSLD